MDSKLESDFDFKDSEVESEEEMESDAEDITLKEIQSDAELPEFALRLQEAHDQMVAEEKSKWAAKKKEVHLLREFRQVKVEVEAAREKSRGGQFPFHDKVLPEADGSAQGTENLRISSRGEPNQAWKCHSTIKSQIQEHIQNPQQDEHPEVEILSCDPEEAPPTTGTKDAEEPEPETLDHCDLPALCRAKAELEVRHKKKNLDLLFQV